MMKAHWLLLAACLTLPASAQLRLPNLPSLPSVPSVPSVPTVQQRLPSQRPLDTLLAPANLAELRATHIEALLRRHPRELQRDPRGEPVVRGELLALPSTQALREQLLAEGFVLLREQVLDGLDERWLVLQPPPRANLADALERLRRIDPEGQYDFHHLYTGSASAGAAQSAGSAAGHSAGGTAGNGGAAATASGLRLGLIDGGVDRQHPALAAAAMRVNGCGGSPHPSAHGTAVASLLVGASGNFRGALPDGRLWAADVYCDVPTGGSVQAIAEALAWLAREQVAVINVSLVGPPNRLLERAVAALVARGHLLVAAVGNDGPAAAPLYPAAWPGVVAVSATDARRRLLPEAGRGPHVAFAAPGADLAAASRGESRYEPVRGTSFAAPLVAGLLAALLQHPDPAAAAQALAALSAQAIDLGASGRDSLYGWGLVGEALRIDPTRVAGKR